MKVPKNKTGENNPNTRVVNTEDADLNSLNIPENDVVEKEEANKEKEEVGDKRYEQEFDIPGNDDDPENELTEDGENKYF